jgi:uncharacterized protein (DUF2237 family)
MKSKLFFFVCLNSLLMNSQNINQQSNCILAKNATPKNMETIQKNVLGGPLSLASKDPLTGYFRTGFCTTDANDRGLHVVAAVLTTDFLIYSRSQGNDLISPNIQYGFPGLKAGNIWCLCVLRWKEALEAGFAPPIILEATNAKALEHVSLEVLKQNEYK